MKASGLEGRIAKLEQQKGGAVDFIARRGSAGELQGTRGMRLARFVAVLPNVCAIAEEWIERCAPRA